MYYVPLAQSVPTERDFCAICFYPQSVPAGTHIQVLRSGRNALWGERGDEIKYVPEERFVIKLSDFISTHKTFLTKRNICIYVPEEHLVSRKKESK